MKIKGKVALLFDVNRGLTIEIEDRKASTKFIKLNIKAENVIEAFCQRADIDCTIEVEHLDRVGTKHKHKVIEFLLPEHYNNSEDRIAAAKKECLSCLPKGWVLEDSFSSQDSFFVKEGSLWARATIRKYKKNKSKKV